MNNIKKSERISFYVSEADIEIVDNYRNMITAKGEKFSPNIVELIKNYMKENK